MNHYQAEIDGLRWIVQRLEKAVAAREAEIARLEEQLRLRDEADRLRKWLERNLRPAIVRANIQSEEVQHGTN